MFYQVPGQLTNTGVEANQESLAVESFGYLNNCAFREGEKRPVGYNPHVRKQTIKVCPSPFILRRTSMILLILATLRQQLLTANLRPQIGESRIKIEHMQ